MKARGHPRAARLAATRHARDQKLAWLGADLDDGGQVRSRNSSWFPVLLCAWLLWAEMETREFRDDKLVSIRNSWGLKAAFPTYEKCLEGVEQFAANTAEGRPEARNVRKKDASGPLIGGGRSVTTYLKDSADNWTESWWCYPDSVKQADLPILQWEPKAPK